jgi:hypothetical protein
MYTAPRRLRGGSHHQGRKAIYASPHRQLLIHGTPSRLPGDNGDHRDDRDDRDDREDGDRVSGTPGVPRRGPG